MQHQDWHVKCVEWFEDLFEVSRTGSVVISVLIMGGVVLLVYITGGAKYVYSHTMYLAIIAAAFFHGIKGGVVSGLIGGLALGPFMPLDVATGEMQEAFNWLYRTGFFALIGLLCGSGFEAARYPMNQLKRQAGRNTLTGLPNRFALVEDLEKKRSSGNELQPGTFMFFSLENAAEIRSHFGFGAMDDVIRQLAIRISETVEGDAYHLYPNLLGVLFFGKDVSQTSALSGSLEEKIQLPYESNGIPLHGEILIACTDITAEEGSELFLRRCEAALQDLAKQPQRSTSLSFRLDGETGMENLKLLGELKESLGLGHLRLHFQPKVNIRTRTITSAEALIRWEHPGLGNISPGRFIPSVENSTLIIQVTDWVIDNALSQMVRWREDGLEIPVAVNVSMRNLVQPDFSDKVMRSLDLYQIEGKFLELEITESAIMQDIAGSIEKLKVLTRMHINISIDDFGTGFSSLSYLRRIPAGKIKIDQSFIKNMLREEETRQIVETSINLAHGLGKLVVAEGVEDRETFDLLGEIGCDEAQGFFISRPMPALQFFDLNKSWTTDSLNTGG